MAQPDTTAPSLAKTLKPISVWALSLGCIVGWGSFILPGTTFLPQAGPVGTAIAMGIAALVMIVIALNYSFLIERFPVAGGEYTYVHRTLGATHAFITSWLLGLCYLSLVAQNATALTVVARALFGGVFQVGYLYTVAGFEVYAGEVVLALVALAVFAALSVRGVRLAGMLQTVLVLALVGGIATVCLAGVQQMGGAFLAPVPAFSPNVSPLGGVLSVLAIAPFAFVGFDTIPQAAEEYHFPARKARGLVVLSIVVGALLYTALALLAASSTPAAFSGWPAYVQQAAHLEGVQALPTFYSAHALLGPVGVVLLGIAVLGAILSGIVGFYMATSRLLFALGRDGLLPAWFSTVHGRYFTPHHAILFVMAVSAVAPFFGRTVLGWLVDMSALGAAVAYAYTSFVAWRTARAESKPAFKVLGLLGLVFSIVFVVLLLVPLPGVHASLGVESYICLFIWVVLGVAFYTGTKQKHERVT